MEADQIKPLLNEETDRREWTRPVLIRLDAGSAENDAGPSMDLAVNS